MKLLRTDLLTPTLHNDLLQLKKHCEEHLSSSLSYGVDEQDPELSYRYYTIYEDEHLISALILSLYADSDSPFFDFFAMTEPSRQGQGFFTDLFEEMLSDLEEQFPDTVISSDLFVDNSTLLPGFLESLGYEKRSSEYLMEISSDAKESGHLTLEATRDQRLLASYYRKIFGVTGEQADAAMENLMEFETWYLICKDTEPVGMVLLMEEAGRFYLSNFGIFPEYRRNHYAWQALDQIRHQLAAPIFLQVSSENLPAFSLYQAYGFAITKEFVCYHMHF